jgi:hypothetical protein
MQYAMPAYHLATFAVDVTPPEGHPLCGGWIEPVRGVDDPLKALGIVLLGMGKPVVLCVFDWVALRNDAHLQVRQALAEAAHTTIEHVSVHAVHPHNAPFADVQAQKLLEEAKGPPSLDRKFFAKVCKNLGDACRESLAKAKRFTHIGTGSAKVENVASNRRVLGPDGKVKFTRTSATKDPVARAEAEGLIDPTLRTFSFRDGDRPLVAMHFYATHPMSYYGDGRVSADFCGLARQTLQEEMPEVFQMYFTGCAGNITAGKYNDGSKENRIVLRDRIAAAMREAWKSTKPIAVTGWEWRVEPVKLPPRTEARFGLEESRKVLNDAKAKGAPRANAAFQIAWLMRQDRPIDLACLDFGDRAKILLLPGEAFIEYQLAATALRPGVPIFVASYGDDGCGYIPTAAAFLEGGYEPTVALAGPECEAILRKAMGTLLKG